MASLGEAFCLGEIFNDVKLSGVEKSECDDSVLVSLDAKSNRIMKVQDQKITQSWSLRQGDRITSPAIFNKTLGEFIVVVNYKSLRLWNKDCVNFEKAKKKSVDHSVHRILNREEEEPLVLFSNGSINTLSNCKQLTASGYVSSCDVIVSSTLCQTKDNDFVVYITTDQKKKVTVHTCVYCSRAGEWKHKSHCIDKDSSFICCCTSVENNACSVFFLWSNGELDEARISVEMEFVTLSTIYTLTTPACEYTSMVQLDSTHIAISGIKKNEKSGIGILETKFQAVQAFQEFPDEATNPSLIFSSNRYIYCACEKRLFAFPYKCALSSVAGLIGQTSTEQNTSAPVFANQLQWNVHSQTVVMDNSAKELQELFEEICNPDKCSSYTSFKKLFTKILKEVEKPENKYWIASYHMSKLVNRCTKEETFWPHTEIVELIKKMCIPSSCISDLFEALIKHKQYSTLQTAFQCLNYVPESAIVKCLQFYTSSDDKEFSKLKISKTKESLEGEHEESQSPYSYQKAHFINQLFSISFSDVFLLECLRSLEFKTVLDLLEHLYSLLKNGIQPTSKDKPSPDKLTQNQVLEWINLLLDAHMTQLIISPDSHKLLINLHETVQSKLQFCEDLVSLEAVLSQLKEKCTITSQQKVGQYCIEVLHVL